MTFSSGMRRMLMGLRSRNQCKWKGSASSSRTRGKPARFDSHRSSDGKTLSAQCDEVSINEGKSDCGELSCVPRTWTRQDSPELLLPLPLDNNVLCLFRIVLPRRRHHPDLLLVVEVARQSPSSMDDGFQAVDDRAEVGVDGGRRRDGNGERDRVVVDS